MRVLVDCTQITRQKAGVGVYALNLVTELFKHQQLRDQPDSCSHSNDNRAGTGKPLEIWLLAQDDDPAFCLEEDCLHVIRVPARIFRLLPLRLLLEQIYIPWLTRKMKIDVLHSLHYSFPLVRTSARKVVTVHDLTSLLMPQVHIRSKRLYYIFFLRVSSRLADAVIFVSRSTQEDWRRHFPRSPVKQFVIPLGKGPNYRPDLPSASIRDVLKRHNLSQPYLLYIGTIEPRKNLTRLVQAFARVQAAFPSHTLVIAGKKGWMYDELFRTIAELGLEDRIIFTGFVEEQDKPYLIVASEIFVYPSLYEGFGIPVLEALACGAPTLTSDNSSLREVAGDAALLVNPESVEDISLKIEMLLSDSAMRESLRAKAIRQAAKFDWARMAQETLQTYRSQIQQ
ncbi:MAG TPA: glycosyltransferase family 1 protein [Acidobacteriaceae bacterium]|nr:glycosyltransferase family 1 protein [Acidobacteriaceae bacterium]